MKSVTSPFTANNLKTLTFQKVSKKNVEYADKFRIM